jgi:hypothetical protein
MDPWFNNRPAGHPAGRLALEGKASSAGVGPFIWSAGADCSAPGEGLHLQIGSNSILEAARFLARRPCTINPRQSWWRRVV